MRGQPDLFRAPPAPAESRHPDDPILPPKDEVDRAWEAWIAAGSPWDPANDQPPRGAISYALDACMAGSRWRTR